MSSNLRVNNIFPSVGTNVAIGTAGGSVTLTGGVTATTLNATSLVGVTTAGITTVYTNSINNGQLGGSRNMVTNGAMVVNQRGFTGAAGTTSNNGFPVDRFIIGVANDGAVSAGQTTMNSTVGGNAYANGFSNATILRVTTADATLGSSQYQLIYQPIEGSSLQGIKKGTANAQPVTLSFWCRSTTTGTYIAELYDAYDNTRHVSQAYTINAANTWEKKVLVFPADTIGAFDNDANISLAIIWWLAAGSDFTSGTLNTSWATIAESNRAVGQVNLMATAGNDFFLTGVQLEVGDRATEFERRFYTNELQLCQRYYEVGGPYETSWTASSAYGAATVVYATQKRASPNVTITITAGQTGTLILTHQYGFTYQARGALVGDYSRFTFTSSAEF